MPSIILALLLNIDPFALFPDSANVTIINSLESASITSIYYLIAGEEFLAQSDLDASLSPGSSASISLPFRYLARVIFCTDQNVNYRIGFFSPSSSLDSVSVSRSEREFGGYFDVIMGRRPFTIRNSTTVPITAIILHGDSLPSGSIIGSNPIMTDETLFLWLDRDSVVFTALDIEGNESDTIEVRRMGRENGIDIRSNTFIRSAPESSHEANWVVSALNGECIMGIEVYPINGEPFFMDLGDNPLQLWQFTVIPFDGDVEYIVCDDNAGRTFTIDQKDQSTGAFVVDWWHLDFDFSFPERAN